jgi:hypothetical protein
MHHREDGFDTPTGSYLLSPSPNLSNPTFETRQTLQLGLSASTIPPNTTSSAATAFSSAASSKEPARKSGQPQPPGSTPNRLQAILARNRADRRRPSSPLPTMLPASHALRPARPQCLAKDRLLRWRPLLTSPASSAVEDLEKRYQLTALAWEPYTLTSYASGLLVSHT